MIHAAVALRQPRLVLVDLELDGGLVHIPPQSSSSAGARRCNILAPPRRVEGRATCGQGERRACSAAQHTSFGVTQGGSAQQRVAAHSSMYVCALVCVWGGVCVRAR